jgi:Domain of unknown function (DUF5615)
LGGWTESARFVKVLLDEQLSHRIAHELRKRDLDVEAVSERSDLLEAPDLQIMETAGREERAVVTNNVKDFRPIAAERLLEGRGHAGLILLPASRSRRRDSTGALADAVEAVMRAHPKGIPGVELWIGPLS